MGRDFNVESDVWNNHVRLLASKKQSALSLSGGTWLCEGFTIREISFTKTFNLSPFLSLHGQLFAPALPIGGSSYKTNYVNFFCIKLAFYRRIKVTKLDFWFLYSPKNGQKLLGPTWEASLIFATFAYDETTINGHYRSWWSKWLKKIFWPNETKSAKFWTSIM